MFKSPDHYHNLSLRLSQVMDDMGVNQRLVLRRRRAMLLNETIVNISMFIQDNKFSILNFGSQTEGSTTVDLKSDIDALSCYQTEQIIQDWLEWKPGMSLQYMMIQDETTSPGHCLLQAVSCNIPIPVQHIQHEHHSTDSIGRVLLKHSWSFRDIVDGERHGPAQTRYKGPNDYYDLDVVIALSCPSWPKEAEPWLHQQTVSGWPTEDMKRYAAEHGCFVVPVASRVSVNQDTEWRISTSLAERCLLFSLNMTQISCYILMKMIIKTYIKPKCEDAISSFMCKTVLFHCIADSRANKWNDSQLVPCLNQCLQYLFHCVLSENLPHFITPGNNLLAGKLSSQTKQEVVVIMIQLTTNIGQSLLGISIDRLGNRLHVKSGGLSAGHLPSSEDITCYVLATNTCAVGHSLTRGLTDILYKTCPNILHVYQKLTLSVCKLCQIYSGGNRLEQAACELYAPFICASIGSIIASVNIYHCQAVSPAALMWFSTGLNSDFSSSKLKLASALYCAGHYEQCEAILSHLTQQLELTAVLIMCRCFSQSTEASREYVRICQEKNEVTVIKQNIVFCVEFLPCEVNCVPEELRYEMFRSTEDDLQYRGEHDFWMDWAVIDSKPYLYFLQYKVYRQLHRPVQQQQQALLNLAWTIATEPNLGHKETALNLLGQCMEHENRKDEAFHYYTMSLNVRPRNNAAKRHICRLLARQFNH